MTTNRTKAILYDNRAYFFWVLAFLSILSIFAYIYAVNTTARNIANRQSLEREIAQVSGSLSSLEYTYIELRNNVTIELANEYGFKEVKSPLYISRGPSGSLSFNTLNR